ncbi:MAG TPA: hypothetical protein VFO35_04340 [Steroidobacteraceae bacterium]|nr:hypothetical protein [Steroidobacteraceae bacterium]
MRDGLSALLLWGIYPAWLLAGAGDYFCHRRTDIERTSGALESWLHFAQFGCLAVAFACALLLEISAAVFAVIVALVLTHSVLSYIDVRYTDGLRRISPIEQTVHGFMDVLPLVAVALLGVQHWPQIRTGSMSFAPLASIDLGRVLLLASFVVLAGLPIVEELLRCLRHHEVEHRDEGQKGYDAERNPPSHKAPIPNR